jgi:hypothetical protein
VRRQFGEKKIISVISDTWWYLNGDGKKYRIIKNIAVSGIVLAALNCKVITDEPFKNSIPYLISMQLPSINSFAMLELDTYCVRMHIT